MATRKDLLFADDAAAKFAGLPSAQRNALTGWWHVRGFNASIGQGADDRPAINAAIQACSTAGGGTVYLDQGTYLVAGPITPRSGVRFFGPGAVMRCTANSDVFYGSAVAFDGFTLDGLTIEGTVNEFPTEPKRGRTISGPGTVSAVSLKGDLDPSATGAAQLRNFTMVNCTVRNCQGLPILIKGVGGGVSVTNCRFINNMDVGFTHSDGLVFANNYIRQSADNGVSISRMNDKITCTGNTIENCCYNGIFVSGFATGAGFNVDRGPEHFTITGNVVRNIGHAGIFLDEAPKYGTVVGNEIDCAYRRGTSDSPTDSACVGIFVAGYPSNNRAAPSEWASDMVIAANQIRRASRAGIFVNGARRILIAVNQVSDTGTQYLADGVTAVAAADQTQNVDILIDNATTSSDISIVGNHCVDSRTTPYANWAIVPIGSSLVMVGPGNTMRTHRNPFNIALTGDVMNFNLGAVFNQNTKHTQGATAGANAATGTVAGFDTNGAAASGRYNNYLTAGVNRWRAGVKGTAESAPQTGSDYAIGRYTNAGVFIDEPVLVDRDTGRVNLLSAPVRVFSSTTANRPTPTVAGIGGHMFDTTLGKPIWSDGTNWKDATGTTV